MGFLSDEERAVLAPAEEITFRSPIPTRPFSSDEFMPGVQSEKQREFEARVRAYGEELAAHQGVSRRRFFRSAAGMAAAFLAMNDTWGPVFGVSRAEAATPEMAAERAKALSGQFVMDMHTHFLRDDTRIKGFIAQRAAVGKAGWNPALQGKEQTIEDLKFANYFKEIYLDSDTKVAMISGAPSDIPIDWFLTNEMKADARAKINREAGTRRALSHAIFTPGQPGWLEKVDEAIEKLQPDSFKGYTIGDNTNKDLSKYPWRMDDEKLVYPFYERLVRAAKTRPSLANVCVHKGLFPPSVAEKFPRLLPYCDVSDVGRAAKDWPQLNFVIYHSGYRFAGGGRAEDGLAQFERTGRVEWVNDLADIPGKFGVNNVYGDLGQIFAQTTMAEPRLAAALMGVLVRGLGHERVVWGTDAVWTGSPQWQIESLRRLEIPEDLQRKHGFRPLGAADGPVKSAILGGNNARIYRYPTSARAQLEGDRFTRIKQAYEANGGERSNLVYGYVRRALEA